MRREYNFTTEELTNKEFELVTLIAYEFSMLLYIALGIKTLNKIVELNQLEKDKSICHSHDFCDANMYMLQAIENGGMGHVDINDKKIIRLWNASWDYAKEIKFSRSMGMVIQYKNHGHELAKECKICA